MAHRAPLRERLGTDDGRRPGVELLIDCEEDRTLRAVLAGVLRELTARVQADDDGVQLHVDGGGGQGSLQRAARA
jgi:hypothetical protein